MKHLLSILIILLSAMQFTGSAADNNEDTRKLTRAEKKALKAMTDSVDHFWANYALNNLEFAVLAKRIRLHDGKYLTVNDYYNFLTVRGNEACLQIALENGMEGPNGIGGITLRGKINKAKKKVSKKGAISFSMFFNGHGTSCEVRINVPKTGNWCEAYIHSNFSSFNITMSGPLVPYRMNEQGILIQNAKEEQENEQQETIIPKEPHIKPIE